jgi:NaMN:DMB phosphoribosyltransferase
VDLGCPIAAAVPHLRLPGLESAGPARCLSTGQALDPNRVAALLQRGRHWGWDWNPAEPLLLAECVPGGTSTALAVLEGLGVGAGGLVSGSLRQPAHGLKAALVRRGLAAAGLARPGAGAGNGSGADPLAVLAAVGDPMQALAAGLVGAAAASGATVLLAGGSQMAWRRRRPGRPWRSGWWWPPPPGWPRSPAVIWPCCWSALARSGRCGRGWRWLPCASTAAPALPCATTSAAM